MVRALSTLAITLASGLLLAGAAMAAAGPAPAVPDLPAERPVALSGSAEWTLHNRAGQAYRIWLSLPQGEAPASGHPVLYVLDGNAFFASFHEAKRAQKAFQHAIVVGIAYPTDAPHDGLRRAYDFTPPAPAGQAPQPPLRLGGQDALLDFLADTVMPAVARRFRVDPEQHSLFGHSFGGMWALYAFFTRPGLFQHTVAASPSIWWQDSYLLAHERAYRRRVEAGEIHPVNTSLALMLADGDLPQMRQDAQALQQRLAPLSAYGLRTSHRVEAGEDHMSLPFRLTTQVLNEVLRARRR